MRVLLATNFYTPWDESVPLAVLALLRQVARPAAWVGFLILAVIIGKTIFKVVLRYFK